MEPTGADAGLEELLSARVMLVTGKGGTGKTTLAAALGRPMPTKQTMRLRS